MSPEQLGCGTGVDTVAQTHRAACHCGWPPRDTGRLVRTRADCDHRSSPVDYQDRALAATLEPRID